MTSRSIERVLLLVMLLALSSLFVGGCDRGEQAAPPASRDMTAKTPATNPGDAPQPASPPAPTTAAASAGAARESAGGVSWETPAGWNRGPAGQMRLATLTDGTADVAISRFPGDVGGVRANVDRWRAQISLPPVTSDAEAEKLLTPLDVAGRTVRVADMTGGGQRMLVAVVPVDGGLFFFKMTAAPDVIAARKGAFDALVQSIRVP